jgi:beta-xylosidase
VKEIPILEKSQTKTETGAETKKNSVLTKKAELLENYEKDMDELLDLEKYINGKPKLQVSLILSVMTDHLSHIAPEEKIDNLIDQLEELGQKELVKLTSSWTKFKRAIDKLLTKS